MADGCLLDERSGYKLLEKYESFMNKSSTANEAIFFIVIISQSRILSCIKEVKPNSQCGIPQSYSSNSYPITFFFFLFKMVRALLARCGWDLAGGGGRCWAISSGIFIDSTVKRIF